MNLIDRSINNLYACWYILFDIKISSSPISKFSLPPGRKYFIIKIIPFSLFFSQRCNWGIFKYLWICYSNSSWNFNSWKTNYRSLEQSFLHHSRGLCPWNICVCYFRKNFSSTLEHLLEKRGTTNIWRKTTAFNGKIKSMKIQLDFI